MLEINIEQNADATLVVIKGRMETVAAQDSENKFKSLDEATAGTIYLDCKELEYISSSGLRLASKEGDEEWRETDLPPCFGTNPECVQDYRDERI